MKILPEVEGPARIIGVDNGTLSAEEPYKGNQRKAYLGKCFAMVQLNKAAKAGDKILVKAHSGQLHGSVPLSIRSNH